MNLLMGAGDMAPAIFIGCVVFSAGLGLLLYSLGYGE